MSLFPAVRVVAVTAAYRRPVELARLLASLASEVPVLARVIVVDNGGDLAPVIAAAQSGVPVERDESETNLGCGGGVARGLQIALADPAVTHAWVLDDDAVATPGALHALLVALETAQADVAVPLLTDAKEHIGWFPGPLVNPAWNVIRRRGITAQEFRSTCGDTPLRWSWAPWPSLLVTRRAIETVGLPRGDFWFQGEDIEWTLRLSARFTGVLVPAALCRHLPPSSGGQRSIHAARERLKMLSMLQNNAFTGTHLPHGRRILRHAPGNAARFLWAQRFQPSAWRDMFVAHWLGAVRGRPAGQVDIWRQKWLQLALK